MTTPRTKQIYYDKNAKFKIIPSIYGDDKNQFKQFFTETQKLYCTTGDDNYLFWDFDEENSNIIVDEINNIVENDIFNQITILVLWLFGKNYRVKGYFHCRMENIIEYISMDGVNKFITHHILADDNIIDANRDRGEIISDAKFKINKYIRTVKNQKNKIVSFNTKNNKNKSQKMMDTDTKYFYYKNITYREDKINKNMLYMVVNPNNEKEDDDEGKIVIKAFHERLTNAENNLQSLAKVNKFFWKICTIISIFTTGSFLIYMSLSKDDNISVNNCTFYFK
jgi:hypothetical protein